MIPVIEEKHFRPPRVAVLYHYFHPDDVISARHYGDLCQGLASRGWDVTARPSNRGCRDESLAYPLREAWADITIRRVWRPALRQASAMGRVVNAAWMIAAWAAGIVCDRSDRCPDVLVVGTDPVLSVLVAPVVRRLRPRVRIAHWCFDLHPEASVADGLLRAASRPVRMLERLMRSAYHSCDLIADLGACMRERLERYQPACRQATLIPWALVEPAQPEAPDPNVRRELFGNAPLGLLYSGNFGRAHSHSEFLELARRVRGSGIHFSFGVRGNRAELLRQAVRADDPTISFAGFAPEADLEKRLGAADIHLVSLRQDWTGLVVPSKFFGSLAVGRPVLFAGSRQSAVARWIQEHRVGWVLDEAGLDAAAAELRELAHDPGRLRELQRHCHRVYQEHFAKDRIIDVWDRELRGLLGPRAKGPSTFVEHRCERSALPRLAARGSIVQ
jgi:glycosyltransferase involved in cell wall biosynthesis